MEPVRGRGLRAFGESPQSAARRQEERTRGGGLHGPAGGRLPPTLTCSGSRPSPCYCGRCVSFFVRALPSAVAPLNPKFLRWARAPRRISASQLRLRSEARRSGCFVPVLPTRAG